MNKMLIVVALIFLICMIIGYARGFIRIVTSLAATLATIILVAIISPYVSDMILDTIPIENMLQEKSEEILGIDAGEGEETIPEDVDQSREVQIGLIENAKIPEIFRRQLLENNNEEIYNALGVSSFSTYVSKYFAKLVADTVSFLVVFLVVTILVRILLKVFKVIEKLPIIGGINRLGGGLLGIVTGLIIVWVLFIVVTLVYDTELGKQCMESIGQNTVLTKLYENNILMNYITKFRG